MNAELVANFEKNKQKLAEVFAEAHPSYTDIVRETVRVVAGEEYTDTSLDPERITVIDHGDYQGTILFVIAAEGYQPSAYWYVKMYYGSCSYCDTLQSIHDSGEYGEKPTEQQVKDYLGLALHVVQGLQPMQ